MKLRSAPMATHRARRGPFWNCTGSQNTTARPANRTGCCAKVTSVRLPVELEGELNFSRRCLQVRGRKNVSDPGVRFVGVDQSRVAVAAVRLRRHELGVVEDIEEFSAELEVGSFRDPRDREDLVN